MIKEQKELHSRGHQKAATRNPRLLFFSQKPHLPAANNNDNEIKKVFRNYNKKLSEFFFACLVFFQKAVVKGASRGRKT
ncbi:MAG: hypothetical protein EOM83_06825 [Clostridia bacterium]|nr:hypothetical protein [Clostridia bacterium]